MASLLSTLPLWWVLGSGGPVTSPVATAVRANAPPVIDGDLTDPAWAAAPPIGDLTQQRPDEGRTSSERTETRVLYDDDAVYFGIRCFERDPSGVVARLTRRDRDVAADAIHLDLSPGDHAYHFELNAAGVQRDALRTGDDALNFDWDAVWSSATRLDGEGWTAEVALPLTALRFRGSNPDGWKMQVKRFIARRDELDLWTFIPRSERGELLRYGALAGLSGVPAPHGLELRPYLLGRVRHLRGEAAPGAELSGCAGMDLRYGLSDAVSLDATVLPDFAQVEADQVVLNLTTFETRFPEKRPFFLEGADLFQLHDVFGDPHEMQVFYSRRVGAPPLDPVVPDGAAPVALAERIPILGAAKLTGRVGESGSLGVIDAATGGADAVLRSGAGEAFSELVAPASNFLVARARVSLLENVRAGVTLADVRRLERPGSVGFSGLCPGGLTIGPDQRCTHDATTGGIDLTWRSDDGGVLAAAEFLGSVLQGGPTRILADGTELRGGSADVGGRLELAKASGRWLFEGVFEAYGRRLDLNDAGYLRSQNLLRLFTRAAWREFDRGPFRETELGLEVFGRNSYDGVPLARGVQVNHRAKWRNAWKTWIELQRYPTTYDNRETRDGVASERADQYGVEWSLETNPASTWSSAFEGLARTTWKGYSLEASVSVTAYPWDRFELSLGPTLERVTGDPRWIETLGASDYLFGLQDAMATGGTLRSTLTFTPTMTLQAYAQLFFTSVRYGALFEAQPERGVVRLAQLASSARPAVDFDEHDAVLNLNVVFRWEYRPGSTLFLVYTRHHSGGVAASLEERPPRFDFAALSRAPVENVFLVKASYFWER